MTNRDLARLCFFLLGAYYLPSSINAVLSIPVSISVWLPEEGFDPDGTSPYLLYVLLLGYCLQLALMLSFILAASWWSRLAFPDSRQVELPRLTNRGVEEVLFSLVGLIMLVGVVPDLVERVVSWYYSYQPEMQTPYSRAQFYRDLPGHVSLLLRFSIGLWLFLGSRGVVALWRSLRAGGSPREAA